ncbi:DUF2231 domain-containing protein [Halopseudomonas sp.]|jgi:uncharacterized membrane protein|uniref:DUF2231 domain-containing protein n=1 Tax=Halopseudomonas sp. TaxID=2901191 RepID=UPI0039E68542
MTVTVDRPYQTSYMTLHPLHAVLLASTIPLFLGALLSDIAYYQSYQIQWSNFSSWLIAGGLVFAGLALLCGVIGLFHAEGRGDRGVIYIALLLAAWIMGFINALVHAKDAWATMPMGLILSVIVTLLVCAATAVRFSSHRVGGAV